MKLAQVLIILFFFHGSSLLASTATEHKKIILALGDSLTEGYGIEPIFSFPAQLEALLSGKKLSYKVINGGISGATTASGLSRLKWFLRSKPDIMILALGANDGLRGLKVEDSKKNLDAIIVLAKKNKIKVLLAGMQMPPNYGEEYRVNFKKMYFDLVKKHNILMIPFLLEGVAGNNKLNIEDGIHPNKEGYKVITNTVYAVLKDIL